MPFLNRRGEWCSGIAGVGVYWQGGTIWGPGTAGGAQWLNDDEVIAQFFEPGPARLRAFNVRTKAERDLHVAPISSVWGSGNGHWVIQTQTEVLDWAGRVNGRPPGQRPKISGVGPMAADGSYPVKIDFQSWGPYEIVRPDGTFYRLTGPEDGPIDYSGRGGAKVDASQIEGYGGDRWTWVDNDGNPRALNLPEPEPLMRPFWWFKYVFIEGQIWQLYQMGDGRTVLHRRGEKRGHIIHDGDAFNTNAWVNGRFVRVVSSTNQGEAAQFVFAREYADVFQGMVDLMAKEEPPPKFENGWFPRLNQGGEIMSGHGFVSFRGKKLLEPGGRPQWIDNDYAVALGPSDYLWMIHKSGTPEPRQIFGVPHAHVYGAGGGKWRAAGPEDAGNPRTIWIEFDPTNGVELTTVEYNGRNEDRSIFYGGRAVVEHRPVIGARAHSGFVVWAEHPMPSRIRGWLDGRTLELKTLANDWEGNPVPLKTNDGWYFSFMTNVDLRIRPVDRFDGWIIETGEDMNFNHDALGMGDKIRIVWQDKHGNRFSRDVGLSEARTDTRKPLSGGGGGTGGTLTKNFKAFWQDLWNEFRIDEKQAEILNRLSGDAAKNEITRVHARLCVTGMRRIVRHVDPSVGMEKHYNAVPGTEWFFNPDIMLIYEHGVPWSADWICGKNGRWDQGGEVCWLVHENQDHDAHKRNWLDPLDPKFDGISFDEEGGGGTVATYRDGRADVYPVLREVWAEMKVDERTKELAARRKVTKDEARFLSQIAQARKTRMKLAHPSARASELEDEFKAIQCPAVVETAARCHHQKGMSDVGLSTKNGGNRWRLKDGRNCATDIITMKDLSGSGQFKLVDCVISIGSPESRPTWGDGEENGDSSRPWMQPPQPEGGSGGGGGETGTHKYDGGGNDTGTCDRCGQDRFANVHKIPQSREKHAYDGGEQDTGLCDVCQKAGDDPIHDLTPGGGGGNGGGTVEKHDFKPTKFNANVCAECGLAKNDAVHQKEPTGGGGSVDMTETNGLLREMVAEQKITNRKLDELRQGVIDSIRDFGKLLPGLLGGLGGILGGRKKDEKDRA